MLSQTLLLKHLVNVFFLHFSLICSVYECLPSVRLRTVTKWTHKQSTPDFPVSQAEPWKEQRSHIILIEPAVFCIIHVVELMHMTQQLIWP